MCMLIFRRKLKPICPTRWSVAIFLQSHFQNPIHQVSQMEMSHLVCQFPPSSSEELVLSRLILPELSRLRCHSLLIIVLSSYFLTIVITNYNIYTALVIRKTLPAAYTFYWMSFISFFTFLFFCASVTREAVKYHAITPTKFIRICCAIKLIKLYYDQVINIYWSKRD